MKAAEISFNSAFQNEIQSYLAEIQEAYSKSWYLHTRSVLKKFDLHLSAVKLTEKEITEQTVMDWIKNLQGSSRTVVLHIIILRGFLRYLLANGYKAYIPPQPHEKRTYMPYIFTEDEIDRIFQSADTARKPTRARKNKIIHIQIAMILRILYGCGLRVGEAVTLQVSDIDFENGVLILKETKNKKQCLVPMHESLTAILKQYCIALGIIDAPDSFLFQTINHDEHVTVKNARHKFDEILESSNIKMSDRKFHERGPCLHCLRHLFTIKSFAKLEAEEMPVNDAIPYLTAYLGHENLRATEQYLKFSPDLFPEELDKFDDFTKDIIPEENHE
jgi:integrase